MARVALISDTHIPSRASAIPDGVRERIERADLTIHAGDFDSVEVYETIAELSGGDLVAVRGNTDPGSVDLPTVDTATAGGVTFVVTHGTGSVRGYEQRVARVVRQQGSENAVGVSGHTHELLDTTVDGVRLLNPGSATGASPASTATMYVATAEDGDLSVELHEE